MGHLKMKKILIVLLLSILPLLSFAKYCPTCLETFQGQTTRGQTQLFYRWLIKAMNPATPLNKKEISHLFSKKAVIYKNGQRKATGLNEITQYLKQLRETQSIVSAKMTKLLVDQNHGVIAYQTITKSKNTKKRNLIVAIIEYKGHKVIEWRCLSHSTMIH